MWHLISSPTIPTTTAAKHNVKVFTPQRVNWERSLELDCFAGVRGGGTEGEKGCEEGGEEDKRALSALLIHCLCSRGVCCFPACCSVDCLHSLRETHGCYTNTNSHALIVAVTFIHVHTQTNYICIDIQHTNMDCVTFCCLFFFFCSSHTLRPPRAHFHTGGNTWLLSLPRRTASYCTVKCKLQRLNRSQWGYINGS